MPVLRIFYCRKNPKSLERLTSEALYQKSFAVGRMKRRAKGSATSRMSAARECSKTYSSLKKCPVNRVT